MPQISFVQYSGLHFVNNIWYQVYNNTYLRYTNNRTIMCHTRVGEKKKTQTNAARTSTNLATTTAHVIMQTLRQDVSQSRCIRYVTQVSVAAHVFPVDPTC